MLDAEDSKMEQTKQLLRSSITTYILSIQIALEKGQVCPGTASQAEGMTWAKVWQHAFFGKTRNFEVQECKWGQRC